jgi:hypothetical protein
MKAEVLIKEVGLLAEQAVQVLSCPSKGFLWVSKCTDSLNSSDVNNK